jgi:MYXO-CTERM domain-containing protein
VEYFYEGHTYHLTLDPYAIRGGTDSDLTMGDDGKDYVDIRTAWLYGNYLASTGGVRDYSANQIQDVIWYIEAEKSSLTSQEQGLLTLANAGGAVWGTDFHGVMAMNLYGNSGDFNPAQSQLVQVPTVVEVPAPGAVLLGALGLGLVGLIRNRRKA